MKNILLCTIMGTVIIIEVFMLCIEYNLTKREFINEDSLNKINDKIKLYQKIIIKIFYITGLFVILFLLYLIFQGVYILTN